MRYLIKDRNKLVNFALIEKTFVYDAILDSDKDLPADATSIVVNGVLRGCDKLISQAYARGIPWIYIDNGYFGKKLRVSVNETSPTTQIDCGRVFDHATDFEPWRGTTGDHILILPPSIPYMNTFGLTGFLNASLHNLNRVTGRDTLVRVKPLYGSALKKRPLEAHLENAYLAVTWGSAVALEALKKGIPTISSGWCPAKPAGFSIEDIETRKFATEPDRESLFDSLTWFTFDEGDHTRGKEFNDAFGQAYGAINGLTFPIFKEA